MKRLVIAVFLIFLISPAYARILNFDFDTSKNVSISIPGIVYESSVIFQVTTQKSVLCKYSKAKGTDFASMEGSFDDNFEVIHKKELRDLHDGVYRFYVRCRDINDINNQSLGKNELEAVFRISSPIKAQISLEEEILKEGKYEVKLTTTKIPRKTPYLGYSYDGISYSPILLQGSGTNWRGFLIIPADRREGVGIFKFSAEDLEGRVGAEIIGKNSFVVDTKPPATPTSFEAKGEHSQIVLKWSKPGTDVDKINIYRSQTSPVTELDKIKTIGGDEEKYIDTSVENGKTYYYRIDFEDAAGNIGDFSRELRATALLISSAENKSSVLSPELVGKVDALLTEISILESEIKNAKLNMDSLSEEKNKYAEELELNKKISDSLTSLNSIKREVQNYKLQDLSAELLDSKIKSARLRINTLRKGVPESLQILESKEGESLTDLEEIRNVILDSFPELEPKDIDKLSKISFEVSKELKPKSKISVIETTFLDGSKLTQSLIEHDLPSKTEEEFKWYLRIPESMLSGPKIKFKTSSYDREKDDLFSFNKDAGKIKYVVDKKLSGDVISSIKISPVKELSQSPSITGNFLNFPGAESIGTTFLVIVALTLSIYLLYVKRKKAPQEESFVRDFIEKARMVKKLNSEGKIKEAMVLYNSLKEDYLSLSPQEKKKVFREVKSLVNKK